MTNADRIRSMTDEELAESEEKMENRYLFRAKRIDNGEWVEGYLSYPFCTEKGNESYYFYAKDSLGFFCRCVVDASTICQCTACKDKNGKLIWENDIVSFAHEKYTEDTLNFAKHKYTRNYAIEFENTFCNYGLRFRNKSIHFRCTKATLWTHDCEVMGNVFDNPELLEV